MECQRAIAMDDTDFLRCVLNGKPLMILGKECMVTIEFPEGHEEFVRKVLSIPKVDDIPKVDEIKIVEP